MSNKKRNPLYWSSEMYWQTSAYNTRLFNMYRAQILALARNRFKWVNLPKTCDPRYLEETLIFQGVATIAYPRKQPGVFYSTQIAQVARPNIYNNPIAWRSIGNNGWSFNVTSKNGVLVWENNTRLPIIERIDIWARELVDVKRTEQMNRMHQKIPYLIKCAQEQEQQAANLYKQMAGGEPAIITTTGIESIDVEVIQTGVPYIGEALESAKQNIWNEIYTGLGISNLMMKSERLISSEVKSQKEPVNYMFLDELDARRRAVEELNARFSKFLIEPVKVVKNYDFESENYNFINNFKDIIESEGEEA